MNLRMNQRRTTVSVLASALLCLALTAHADPPTATPPAEAKAKVRPSALQALAEARNKGKAQAATNTRGPNAATSAAQTPDAPMELKERAGQSGAVAAMKAAADRAKREQVRRGRQRELRTKLKVPTIPPRVRVELRNHARRISRLQRIRVLAAEDAVVVARVDALIAKENANHDRRIAVLVLAGLAADPAAREGASENHTDQDDEAEE